MKEEKGFRTSFIMIHKPATHEPDSRGDSNC